ncbi:MAG: GNAT family N-acetyltransferase [Acidimicrobiia bacterium]|nr:GNAT family N-acetyltransferase [Acidimicrobiia bacterium]
MSTLDEQLDNPVWWALTGPHRPFALRSADGTAARYRPDVAMFAAVDRVDGDAWAALHEVAGPGGVVALFRSEVGSVPDGWTEVYRGRAHQLTSPPVDDDPDQNVVELGADDADAMYDLARATRPGPFEVETHRLGTYLGVRDGDRLVAMAGERFSVPGATEISAVCTHESARRQGWGARLTREVARRIQARGEMAFLHVEDTNTDALRLYRQLGFDERTVVEVVAVIRAG